MNKIYIQNNGWAGMIVVVAQSLEEAKKLMKDYHNYDEVEPIQEFEIEKGFKFANYGDL